MILKHLTMYIHIYISKHTINKLKSNMHLTKVLSFFIVCTYVCMYNGTKVSTQYNSFCG